VFWNISLAPSAKVIHDTLTVSKLDLSRHVKHPKLITVFTTILHMTIT